MPTPHVWTAFTRTLNSACSTAADVVSPTTPCLAALQWTWPGIELMPATELMLMIDPLFPAKITRDYRSHCVTAPH